MNQILPLRSLDDYVAAFEGALAGQTDPVGLASLERVDLANFLPSADDPLYLDVLIELIRVELEHDWERGTPRPLSDYQRRFPDVFSDPDRLGVVAFEEYRLRRLAGEDPSPEQYACDYGINSINWPTQHERRQSSASSLAQSYLQLRQQSVDKPIDFVALSAAFPAEGAVSRLLAHLHRTDKQAAELLADGMVRMPQAGHRFLDFLLVEELGRGAFGRVFLARQKALADRLVALKIAPDIGGESQTLAQLQHTHIVPIYSVHRSDSLHAVCMPYFGAVTLSDVLRDLHLRPTLPQAGLDLISFATLHRQVKPTNRQVAATNGSKAAIAPTKELAPRTSSADTTPSPVLRKLRGLSYVEAVVWLGSCLADGLAHAHERGILHRDLKPANILLTDEGIPMLLDFNLAEDVKLRGLVATVAVGGTVPYMAPEHLAGFRGDRVVIDERADLFSLGMILYELLTGQLPFPHPFAGAAPSDVDAMIKAVLHSRQAKPVPVHWLNRAATPAVWSILRRCLDPDPAKRYRSARELQEDLECQLQALPLRHAPELSIGERIRKKFRRNPRLLPRVVAAAALGLLALAAVVMVIVLQQKLLEEERADRQDSERREEKARADRLAERKRAHETFAARLSDIRHAQFLLTLSDGPGFQEQGTALAGKVLEQYGVMGSDAESDWREGVLVAALDKADRKTLQDEIGDMLVFLARRVPSTEALLYLAAAERCYEGAVPPALGLQRAGVLEQLGRSDDAKRCRDQAIAQKPKTARDHYLLARFLLDKRDFKRASVPLLDADALDPQSRITRFLLGLCYDGLDDPRAAVACYDVCVALVPDFVGGYFNRGLARVKQKQFERAREDFDRVIQLRPDLAEYYLNRGLVRASLGNHEGAVEDFTAALKRDEKLTRLYFLRSLSLDKLGRKREAEADFEAGMRMEPRDARSWNARGHAHLKRNEVEKALECFNRGIAINPHWRDNLTSKSYVLAERVKPPRTREALAVSEQVVKGFPNYPYGYTDRGILRARLGEQRQAAIDDARTARNLARERADEPELLYRVACIYAQTAAAQASDADIALGLLHEALRRGFGAEELPDDADLKPLHGRGEFEALKDLAIRLVARPKMK